MTIRQIAETAGCNIKTVRELGKKMFPMVKQLKKGFPIEYTEDQIIKIMNKLPKTNYIADPTQMGTPSPTNIGTPIEMALIKLVDQNTKMMAMMMQRMDQIENKNQLLSPKQLALPSAPDIKPRAYLNKLIREFASLKNIEVRFAWYELYEQILYRCHENIKLKASNEGIKPIDYLERENKLLTACSIMKDLLK